jgi:hypothetical protein
MSSRRIVLFAFISTVLAMGMLAACGGGGQEQEVTPHNITDADLTMMVLSMAELRDVYPGFEGIEVSSFKTNEQTAEEDSDPQAEAEDLARFGRVKEYVRTYGSPQMEEPLGPERAILLVSRVQLFQEAEGASGYLKDDLAEMEADAGKKSEGAAVEQAKRFEVKGLGDEAAGMRARMVFPEDDGPGIEAYGTWVFFRRDRLLSSVLLVTMEDTDVSATVEALSGEADNRIQAILLLTPQITPTPAQLSPTAAQPTATAAQE